MNVRRGMRWGFIGGGNAIPHAICRAVGYNADMPSTFKQTVTVRSGGVVEVRSPELHEGDEAEVTVVVNNSSNGKTPSSQPGGWRRFAGAVKSSDLRAGDNERVDTGLAQDF